MARERLTYLPIAVFLWVCGCHAQNPPLFPPPPASEPSALHELYRVTPAGTLEKFDLFTLDQWGRTLYFKGEASSVVFKPGEAQVMAIRLVVPVVAGLHPKEHPPEEIDFFATRLNVLHTLKGKRFTGRFISTDDLPLAARSYGTPTPHPDKKWPDRREQSYLLIPRQTLPPGEYVFHFMLDSNRQDEKFMKNYWDIYSGARLPTFGVAGP